jgi:hypothetical protein
MWFDIPRDDGVSMRPAAAASIQMDAGREWVYPAAGFEGRGRVGGRPVRCLTPEVQVLVHDGYELEEKDFRELRLLRDRLGVELPAAVAARVSAIRDV